MTAAAQAALFATVPQKGMEPKVCPECGKTFEPPAGYGPALWSKRKTCSVSCAQTRRARGRRKSLRHGTRSGYSWYKCRCDACVEAYRTYRRDKYGHRSIAEVREQAERRHASDVVGLTRAEVRRVLAQAQRTEACWLWRTELRCGYPKVTIYRRGKRRCVQAHRKIYETFVGPIPAGHDLHHTCFNGRCINPKHLVPLTPTDHALLHGNLRGGG